MWWQQRVQFSLWNLFSEKLYSKKYSTNVFLTRHGAETTFCYIQLNRVWYSVPWSKHWMKDLSFSWITLHQYLSQGRKLYLSFPCIVEEKKRNYLATWFIKGRVHPALGSSRGLIHTIHIKCYSQTSLVQRTSRRWCNHVMQDWFLKQKLQNSRDKETILLKPFSKCYTLAERQK